MAVQEQTPYVEYVANGITTSFALGFDCDNRDHLIVLVDDVEPVEGAWSFSNGAVVFNAAPENGKKITIQRNTPFSRTTDYQSYNNSFRPPAVNKDFDWIWLKLQELGVADWILSNRIDALKNYVDDRDDELRAYLLEEIRKQGVALDQLDEYYNYLMERLAQIAVDKGWDASFVVDGNKNQHQINAEIAIKTRYANNIVVTPENFGASVDKPDNTQEIQNALLFVKQNGGYVDGGHRKYKAANIVLDSNMSLRNIYLENNVFDQNLVSVLTTGSVDAERTPIENVELINVHIDGKRSMLTNMPTGSFSEDGGRHGFRFVRPMRNVLLQGCSANYCGNDGIEIYPIREIPHSEWQYWVENVVIENCDFHFNGRHGGSSDSCNGLTLRNCRLSGNGTDLIEDAPSNTGNAGRRDLITNNLYGNGWDCEEYMGHAASTNVSFINCVMIDNAGSGLNFTRTGGITKVMDNLLVVGGKYNKGVVAEFTDAAINLTGYLIDFYNWYEITLIDVDFSGDDFYILRSKATLINPKNLGTAYANDRSTLYYDKPDLKISNWASGVMLSAHLEVKSDGVSQQLVVSNGGDAGATSSIIFFDPKNNYSRGHIHVVSHTPNDAELKIGVGGLDKFTIPQNGSLVPENNGTQNIGWVTNRISKIYANSLNLTLPVFENNVGAKAGGLQGGDFYRTATGQVMIVF